jgi:hypothetical protein
MIDSSTVFVDCAMKTPDASCRSSDTVETIDKHKDIMWSLNAPRHRGTDRSQESTIFREQDIYLRPWVRGSAQSTVSLRDSISRSCFLVSLNVLSLANARAPLNNMQSMVPNKNLVNRRPSPLSLLKLAANELDVRSSPVPIDHR